MNGSCLLDTNIVIALFAGEELVVENVNNVNSILLPLIVVGELFYGACNSINKDRNIQKIIELCEDVEIIKCDFETARYYGKIKKELKEMGKPIPENDIWIGAMALQHNIPIITRDIHLHNISEINIIKW